MAEILSQQEEILSQDEIDSILSDLVNGSMDSEITISNGLPSFRKSISEPWKSYMNIMRDYYLPICRSI